jgi:hypothetical protein
MKLPRLTFTSHRDTKGYQIVGVIPPPRRGRKQTLDEILDAPTDEVPSGRLGKPDKDGRVSGEWISGYIVGKGGRMEEVHLNEWPHAFEDFAAVKTPEELLKFVTAHGPLTNTIRQAVLPLLDEAMQMRETLQGGKTEYYPRTLSALLYKDRKTGELEISITPTSLLDALWLQFQHSQSSSAVFRTCPYCHQTFAAGGNSGRLRNAQFCSPEHRKRFNSLARSNPKLRERRK